MAFGRVLCLAARRASDLRREAAAAAASSSESLAALRKEAEQSHTIHTNDQQTIARLSAELEACKEASDAQLRRSEEALAIKAAAAARSESMASMAMGGQFEEEVRKSKDEMRRAMDSADDAQREASEARERVRELELELELEKQRVQGAGEAGLYHRRRRTTHGQGKHPPPSEASQPPPPPPQQQQQQQPGLVITPEALNW